MLQLPKNGCVDGKLFETRAYLNKLLTLFSQFSDDLLGLEFQIRMHFPQLFGGIAMLSSGFCDIRIPCHLYVTFFRSPQCSKTASVQVCLNLLCCVFGGHFSLEICIYQFWDVFLNIVFFPFIFSVFTFQNTVGL